ncbi:light-mediated development protein DET1 [Mycolicibacterium sarraceniae]|uniref:light-mediated development protein DET1 n=1 Tax=Mycolicibacterium sarraceniae TaxID=1534348 RepID=UPI0013D5BB92|nr:light-mediated development protein DET1 [Mycolicibacterium sarraceniae]
MTSNETERVPVGYIGDVRLDHWPEPERAILHSREGNKVYLRGADPCDEVSERVPVYEGDEVIVMEHIAYISAHTEPEGAAGYMLSQRVVPLREEPGKVFARTLRHGEEDDGRRAHCRPGDEFVLEEMQISVDHVDEWEGKGVDGYVPLTPVLFTWMSFATHHSAEKHRYLLAAARRLDQAQSLFDRIDVLRQSDPEGAPAVRRAVFELVGTTELATVSLGRVVDMCMQARTAIGAAAPVPADIRTRCDGVRAIRNAYEHIEDRALGNVQGSPHPDALTIFNHQRVVADGVIEYGTHQLDLSTDVPSIVNAARQYLKDVAKEV